MRCTLILIGLLLLLPNAVDGAILTFAFEGVVDHVGNNTSVPVDMEEADRFLFTYTFDSNAVPQDLIFSKSYNGIFSSLKVGNMTFTPVEPPNIQIQYTLATRFQVFSRVAPGLPGLQPSSTAIFELYSNRDDVFPSGGLPSEAPDLTVFSFKNFSFVISDDPYQGNTLRVYGTIDASYAIPEPTASLMLMACSLLFTRRRLRRSR